MICPVGGQIFTKSNNFFLQSCLIYAITKDYQQIQPTFSVYPPLHKMFPLLRQSLWDCLRILAHTFGIGFVLLITETVNNYRQHELMHTIPTNFALLYTGFGLAGTGGKGSFPMEFPISTKECVSRQKYAQVCPCMLYTSIPCFQSSAIFGYMVLMNQVCSVKRMATKKKALTSPKT